MLWRLRDRFPAGRLFALYLVLAGTERFLVEFIRRNDDVALGLTQAQLISVAMVIAGAAWLAFTRRRAGTPAAARSLEDAVQPAAVERDHGAGQVGGPIGAEEGDEVAVFVRRPSLPAGTAVLACSSAASSEPLASARRSVANIPVATVLTVIPSPATSVASVFSIPTAAIRWELESASPGIGSRVEVEPTLTIRPQPRSRMPGTTAEASTSGASTSER